MNIDAFINDTVKAHNRYHSEIVIAKSCKAGYTRYFLYQRDHDIWSWEDVFLYKYLYEKLSQDGICPALQLREIDGQSKIGIAFEVKI